jgi:hypothetical protein
VTANLEMIKDERIAADLQAQALSTRERLDRYQ